ncbi:hypothetical protein [Mycobacteroides abscessus]
MHINNIRITLAVAAVALTCSTACSTHEAASPGQPRQSLQPMTLTTPAKPTGPGAYVGVATVPAQTVTIANTGVRCFVGKASTACTAAGEPMIYNGHQRWTVALSVQHDGTTEPGFLPGQFANTNALAAGDLFECFGTVGYIATRDGDNSTVRIIDQERPLRDIAASCDSFTGSFYRPNPGSDLRDGSSTTVNGWNLALAGKDLAITAGSSSWKLTT